MADREPDRRERRWTVAGFVTGVVLVLAVVLMVSQTRWGQARVLEFTLGAAGGLFHGELTIERLRGNLLTGARLYEVRLVDPDREPFLEADSVFVEYSLRALIGGDVTLRRLRVFGADVRMFRMPGDTLWNVQRIFQDTVPEPRDPPVDPVVLHNVELVDGHFRLEFPWQPSEGLTAAERQSEIDAALSPDSRSVISEVPGGYLQTLNFRDLNALLPSVQVGPDAGGGTYLVVERLAGAFHIWREPLVIRDLQAEIGMAQSRLEFRASPFTLPSSTISAYGVVRLAEDPLEVDITLGGEEVALADLQWLYPALPDEGGGQLVLVIESREDGVLYYAKEADVRFPGNRLRGDFGILVGPVLQFAGVDLQASPLDLGPIAEMLPPGLPLDNLRIGAARIRSEDL
jgi:hypothetical protein